MDVTVGSTIDEAIEQCGSSDGRQDIDSMGDDVNQERDPIADGKDDLDPTAGIG